MDRITTGESTIESMNRIKRLGARGVLIDIVTYLFSKGYLRPGVSTSEVILELYGVIDAAYLPKKE